MTSHTEEQLAPNSLEFWEKETLRSTFMQLVWGKSVRLSQGLQRGDGPESENSEHNSMLLEFSTVASPGLSHLNDLYRDVI